MSARRRILTTLSWPFAMGLTAFHYVWRILPVHRREVEGRLPDDLPPELPASVPRDGIKGLDEGTGPLLHRIYSCAVADARIGPEELIAQLAGDPDRIAPWQIARFEKAVGDLGQLRVGDEFLVRMPGPWNGPVRTVQTRPDGFRFATLEGHVEAGQIEWRAWTEADGLHFAVESWARQGDALSALLHDTLRMAKEVQLYMWTTLLERVPRLAGGRLIDGVHVDTRRVHADAFTQRTGR